MQNTGLVVPSTLPPSRRFLGDIMVMHSTVSVAVAISSLLLFSPAKADQIALTTTLPPSGEPSSEHNPPCGADGSPTSADAIVSGLAGGVDYIVGLPIASTVIQSDDARNWLKARLDIHNGKASCQTLCGTLPSGASFTATGRVSDLEKSTDAFALSNSNKFHDTDWWAGIDGPTTADASDAKLVCYQVKNWSHDRSRDYEILISY